jgi:hypothetical protein
MEGISGMPDLASLQSSSRIDPMDGLDWCGPIAFPMPHP